MKVYFEARKNMYEMEKVRLMQLINMLQSSIDDIRFLKNDCTEESIDRIFNIENTLKIVKHDIMAKAKLLEVSVGRLR